MPFRIFTFTRVWLFAINSTFNPVVSLLFVITMARVSLSGRWLFEFSPLLGLDFSLSSPPFNFPKYSGWTLWFFPIFCTYSDTLLSKFLGAYLKPFFFVVSLCHGYIFAASFWLLWWCTALYIVSHLFLVYFRGILFLLSEIVRGILASN